MVTRSTDGRGRPRVVHRRGGARRRHLPEPRAREPVAETEGLPPVLSVKQVAEFLKVSNQVVYEEVRQGRLPHVKVGMRLIRIPRQGLQRWLESWSVDSTP